MRRRGSSRAGFTIDARIAATLPPSASAECFAPGPWQRWQPMPSGSRCGSAWERQYDSYGFYIGTVKVCRVY